MQLYLKKIGLILALLFVTALPSFAAYSYTGWTRIDGKWVYGTLFSKSEGHLEDGRMTVQPPWSFVGEGGELLGDAKNPGTLPWQHGKTSSNQNVNANIDFSISSGVTITSNEALTVKVYELTYGTVIYSGNGDSSYNISTSVLNKENTNYILNIIDGNGVENCILFSFNGNETLIDGNY